MRKAVAILMVLTLVVPVVCYGPDESELPATNNSSSVQTSAPDVAPAKTWKSQCYQAAKWLVITATGSAVLYGGINPTLEYFKIKPNDRQEAKLGVREALQEHQEKLGPMIPASMTREEAKLAQEAQRAIELAKAHMDEDDGKTFSSSLYAQLSNQLDEKVASELKADADSRLSQALKKQLRSRIDAIAKRPGFASTDPEQVAVAIKELREWWEQEIYKERLVRGGR